MGMYCLASPTGAVLSYILNYSLSEEVFSQFMAFVIGTFLHISTTILFEFTEYHKFSAYKTYAILAGVFLVLLVVFVN